MEVAHIEAGSCCCARGTACGWRWRRLKKLAEERLLVIAPLLLLPPANLTSTS